MKLPNELHTAYNWTEAAGELALLKTCSDLEASQYCEQSLQNYAEHAGTTWPEGEVTVELLRDLREFLRNPNA